MSIEVWFDRYQYDIDYDIGESAVKYLTAADLELDLDLERVALRYGHHTGQPELRELIATDYPGLGLEHVVVTTGAAEAIFALNAAVARPGDHVIVEHPNYPSLYEAPRSLGCDVELFTLRYEDRFRPDLQRLWDMIRPDTRMISLTHPNNPTGSMISEADLLALVEMAEAHDVYLLFDETYRELSFEAKLPAAASLSPKVISVSTMSKCYGLPGIRIGWAATQSPEILDALVTIREQTTIANNALGEAIALGALRKKTELLERSRAHVAVNREVVGAWMDEHPQVEWVTPEAGVVAFPRLGPSIPGDPDELYRSLVEEHRTFVLPGRVFEMDPRHFRLGFGASTKDIRQGLAHLDRVLATA